MFMDVEVNIGEPTKTGPGMILTCPDVCVIKRCIWAAVNWKSTGWTTFELYLEKCDDVMYITQEVTVLSLERYLKLAICYILVCCLHTIHTIPCRLVKYHEICFFLLCLFSPVAYAGWNCANGWWNMDPTNSQFENGCYIDGWPAGQAPYQFSKIIVIDPLIEGHSCSTYIIICLVGLNICQYP